MSIPELQAIPAQAGGVSIANIIIGVIVILYLAVPFFVGITAQMKAKAVDSQLYGKMPTAQIVLHVLFSIAAIFTAFYANLASGIIAIILYVIKLSTICCTQESKAFAHMRTAQNTDAFLQNLRRISPRAWYNIECFHNEVRYTRDAQGHTHQRIERVVTYRETRYVQITGFLDTTPPMYVDTVKPLTYLGLSYSLTWLGYSPQILEQLRQLAFQQNRMRDCFISITFHTAVDGLTPDNYLTNGTPPSWMTKNSEVPNTRLVLQKFATVEWQHLQQYAQPSFNYAAQAPPTDKISLPPGEYDKFMRPQLDSVSLPPSMCENERPLITQIAPPNFSNEPVADQIQMPIQAASEFKTDVPQTPDGKIW